MENLKAELNSIIKHYLEEVKDIIEIDNRYKVVLDIQEHPCYISLNDLELVEDRLIYYHKLHLFGITFSNNEVILEIGK